MKALVGFILFSIALILCTIFAKPLYEERIEQDLGNKVRNILNKNGLDPAGMKIANHHLDSIGEQPASEAASEELLNELDGVIGLYLSDDLITPRALTPPNFHLAEQADESVLLRGLISDESERKFLVDLAASPVDEGGTPRRVVDQLEVRDDVASIGEKEKIKGLAPQILSIAQEGSLTWSPTDLELGGFLDDEEQKAALTSSAEELSSGSNLNSELEVQPYQHPDFGLERSNRSIVVTGLLPNKDARDHLLNLVRRESRGDRIFDKTTLAVRPHPTWWAKSPETFLPAFLSTTNGRAKVHYYHDRFIAEATFDERADYDVVKGQMAKFPAEAKRATNLKIVRKLAPVAKPVMPSNPIKAEAMISKLKEMAVYFGSSSALIKETEEQKIIDAAKIILASKDVTQGLTVGGYADLRGNASFNKTLSMKRANAVRDQLVAKGVPAERLTVKHFGEDTSRTAKKDLWRSRRVEISLTKKPDKESDQ